jgi:hypothetical protein
LHVIVAWIFVAALVLQVWLAGRGVFESPTVFETHSEVGYTLGIFPIVLLVLGLLGGLGRRAAVLAVGILVLIALQSVFVLMRESSPALAALHPVNGFLILLAAILLAWESWQARTEAA